VTDPWEQHVRWHEFKETIIQFFLVMFCGLPIVMVLDLMGFPAELGLACLSVAMMTVVAKFILRWDGR
jgi:hypothetical protein